MTDPVRAVRECAAARRFAAQRRPSRPLPQRAIVERRDGEIRQGRSRRQRCGLLQARVGVHHVRARVRLREQRAAEQYGVFQPEHLRARERDLAARRRRRRPATRTSPQHRAQRVVFGHRDEEQASERRFELLHELQHVPGVVDGLATCRTVGNRVARAPRRRRWPRPRSPARRQSPRPSRRITGTCPRDPRPVRRPL